MAVLIRTADLSPARRRAAWREAVCETLGRSPGWIRRAAEAVAAAIPGAVHRVLADQTHAVQPAPLASELLEFFTTVGSSAEAPH
ncbi:MAG: hypothetical protein JXA83_16055 [Acidimicrobiales bacterium]|nr:hypothetical protein [Acidimicrobiales bacterium]